MEKWFANRGQVVQVIAAIISLLIVLSNQPWVKEPWVKEKRELILFILAAGWLLFSVVMFIVNRRTKDPAGKVEMEHPDKETPKNEFERLADEDSRNMSKRLILCEKRAKLNVETVEPYIDVTFTLVNTSVFDILADGVEGPAFYRGYSGEKCPLSRTPQIADPMNFFSLPRGEKRDLKLRQFVPISITDNIAASKDALPVYFDDVRVKFKFPGTTATQFVWFGEEIEVGGLSVSNDSLARLGIIPKQSQNKFVSISIISLRVDDKIVSRGNTLKIRYEVFCSEDISDHIWLGASLHYKNGQSFCNVRQDKPVSLLKGTREYDRDLTLPTDAPLGSHTLMANVWKGPLSDGRTSDRLTNGGRVEISVV
jgi:hypothetical protein